MKLWIKRVWGFLIVLSIIVILIACSSESNENEQLDDGKAITSNTTVPLINCDEEFDVPEVNSVELYFLNDETIPYIDVLTYFSLISSESRISVDDIRFTEDTIVIEYNPVIYQYMFFENNVEIERDNDLTLKMEIDFSNAEVRVSSYLFFMFQGKTIENSETETVEITDVVIEEGSEVIIPFDEYNIDFTIQSNNSEQLYLVPFYVANLLFTNSTLLRTYYNGDAIYAGGRCIYNSDTRESSYNGTKISKEMREMSFNLFTLALDYFSAIKDARSVESYKSMLQNQLVSLTTSTSDDYYKEFSRILYRVDDIHAGLPSKGYYASTPTEDIEIYQSWFLDHRKTYWGLWSDYMILFNSKFENQTERPEIRLLDDDKIAVIHLYEFTPSTYEVLMSYLDGLPSSVENVVLDISMNAGGNVNAIFRVLGYMTHNPITFTNHIAMDGSTVNYTVEVSQDVYDYNWYIKTSSLTFSAGNVLALIAQENGIATIVGEKSTGGASAIESILLPCGFSHTISGNYTFYSKTGSAEYGVDVDIPMEDNWDDNELIDIINQQ